MISISMCRQDSSSAEYRRDDILCRIFSVCLEIESIHQHSGDGPFKRKRRKRKPDRTTGRKLN